jgi:predicted metal-binding protein
MGPPAIGPIGELAERARKFRHGLLFQTVCAIDGSADWDGMMAGSNVHEQVLRDLLARLRSKYHFTDLLPLNARCCSLCERCAYLDHQPCRHPDMAVSPVEAYGIDVMALAKSAGIPYYNGQNTVSYMGLILFA